MNSQNGRTKLVNCKNKMISFWKKNKNNNLKIIKKYKK